MNEQEALMAKIRSYQFAMWELHIFLDTHPGDCKAAQKQEEYRKIADDLTAKYEATYGPVNVNSGNTSRWAWISNPWPWDGAAPMQNVNVQGTTKAMENTMPWMNSPMPAQTMPSSGNTAVQGAARPMENTMPWMNSPMPAQTMPSAGNTAVQGAARPMENTMPWMNGPMPAQTMPSAGNTAVQGAEKAQGTAKPQTNVLSWVNSMPWRKDSGK